MYVTTLNGMIFNSPQGTKVLLIDYWTPTEDLRMKQQWIRGFLSGLDVIFTWSDYWCRSARKKKDL